MDEEPTLRDLFGALAMHAVVEAATTMNREFPNVDDAAQDAWDMADAMLRWRDHKPTTEEVPGA